MRETNSTVAFHRLVPALLAATALPAVAFGALLVAVPDTVAAAGTVAAMSDTVAGAGAAARVAVDVPAAFPAAPAAMQSTPSTTPFPPSAPSNLVATEVRTNSVTLTWTASTPGCCTIVGYDISYIRAFNDVVSSVSVGDVTTATITGSISSTSQYQFQVSARDFQDRRSASSNPITVVTPVSDTGPDTTPPQTPTDFFAESLTPRSFELSWTPSTDDVGVTGYQVYHFDGWYTSTLLATVTGTSHPVTLSDGRDQFYVRARDAVGNVSIATNTLTLQAPGTPTPTQPTPPPPSPTRPVEPDSCRVSYVTQAEWTGGFVAAVTIHNTGTTAISGWRLVFGFGGDQQIASAWNARYVQSAASVSALNVDWNRMIPVGGSTSFGMIGAWTSSNAAPTGFALNGTICVTA